jgi:hypothetical protein
VPQDAHDLLRFDRRLVGRRGRVRPEELEREIERLPDVSDKADLVEAPAPPPRREPTPQGG